MSSNKTSTVDISNIYQYSSQTNHFSRQTASGTFELNTEIHHGATPRTRIQTREILSDAPSAAVSGAEKGAESTSSTLPAHAGMAEKIAQGARLVGRINDGINTGQHAIQGHGAEAITEGMGVAGQSSGAWLGAKAGAEFGSMGGPVSEYTIPLGTLFGAAAGAYFGGEKTKALGKYLTGGDTPDLLIPPTPIPNNVKLEPTITTPQGNRYALAKADGHYSWYSIVDNRDLMLPNRYVGIMSGAKIAELTGTYLQAAGYEAQLQERIEHIIEQTRQRNLELHRHNEIAQQNQSEITATHIKQGRAPDGSEIGKMYRSSESSGSSIWIRDIKSQHFIYVGTTGVGEQTQSIELYHDGKTGALRGGKIHVPDGHGKHTVTPFGEQLPDTAHEAKQIRNTVLSNEDTNVHVKHLQLANTFGSDPLKTATKHPELASIHIAQAMAHQGASAAGFTSEQHAIVAARIHENAINVIARSEFPQLQILAEHATQIEASQA